MQFIEDILGGEYDAHLEEIRKTINERQKEIGRRVVEYAKVGDKVRFIEHIQPKYLAGITVELNEKGTSRCKVKFLNTVRRYPEGIVVSVPTELITSP